MLAVYSYNSVAGTSSTNQELCVDDEAGANALSRNLTVAHKAASTTLQSSLFLSQRVRSSPCAITTSVSSLDRRGAGSVLTPDQLMTTIDSQATSNPCEYFDMIGSTSTDG
jgi:hypothetical protein